MQYLTFNLNSVEYAVDVTIVDSIVEDGVTTAVPSPLGYVKGVMDLRGQVIPVVDLRKKLGLPAAAVDTSANVIVISVEADAGRAFKVGALVDEVSAVIELDEAGIERARADGVPLWERYVRGVVRNDGRMTVIVAAEALFSLQEIESLRAA